MEVGTGKGAIASPKSPISSRKPERPPNLRLLKIKYKRAEKESKKPKKKAAEEEEDDWEDLEIDQGAWEDGILSSDEDE